MIKGKLLFLILLFIITTSCSNSLNNAFEDESFAMGTIITQQIYGNDSKIVSDEVNAKINELESIMTINAPDSEIDKLNNSAGDGSWNTLDKEIIYVLKKAIKFSGLSEGAFDITIGPLVKKWNILPSDSEVPSGSQVPSASKVPIDSQVPSDSEVKSLINLTNYKDILIDEQNLQARLSRKGQIVDLGGIAKGYAADQAISIYKKHGITSAYINLGGNVSVLGGKPDGSPWIVGIQNPRQPNGRYIGTLKIRDKTIVTSGDYERYFIKDNIRYHHILDPKTGYPADSGLISTTIITDLSVDADALSTATFVLGLDKGRKLVESLEGVEAIFINNNKEIFITSGLKSIFTFDDESKEFKYVEER